MAESTAAKAELELKLESLNKKFIDYDKLSGNMEDIKNPNSSLKDVVKNTIYNSPCQLII